jgi:hypothetical protein
MGVSYSLDVSDIKMEHFSSALVNSANNVTSSASTGNLFTFFGGQRMINTANTPDIFPTGEYIIRKGVYINGLFCYVGSYKAYCADLFGAGNDGYAWDGFLLVCKGYNILSAQVNPNIFKAGNLDSEGNVIYNFGHDSAFLPMRMMFEVNPGPIGDAAAIAADDSVGLHGLSVWKDFNAIAVEGNEYFTRFICCGFQRIDSTAEGVPTGSDYVGNLYMGNFLESPTLTTDTLRDGEVVNKPDYNFVGGTQIMQVTWKANQAGHTDKTNVNGRFPMIRDLDQVIAGSTAINLFPYSFSTWGGGTKPADNDLGTNDARMIRVNTFPRRFMDITSFSQAVVSANSTIDSPFIISGDVALDTNNDGTIDETTAAVFNGAYPFGAFLFAIGNEAPFNTQGPYLIGSPAYGTSLGHAGATAIWPLEPTTPQYSLLGSVAVAATYPYEATSLVFPYETDFQPAIMVGITDVSYGASTGTAIYGSIDSTIGTECYLYPFCTPNGNFTTATGIELPTRIIGKSVQFRTFSFTEEDASKAGITNTNTGVFLPQSPTSSVYDADAGEYIGFIGNYERYGLFDFNNPQAIANAVAGQLSGAGYGFLGYKTGTGPIAIMFDSGSPNLDTNLPWTASGVFRAEGNNINSNIVTNPTSTTRKLVNCGWDNDRDQWIFIATDTTGVSVVSVASDFSTASNNVGFLDQTASFGGLTAANDTGLYIPITMSSSLDGWIWFGQLDTNANSVFGVKPLSLGSSSTYTRSGVTYDAYPNAVSKVDRIGGTTGRTAKVWVDYILFDGPDAIIANKIKERGMKVSIEAVEWFKRSIIQSGDLNITDEEIEMWMRDQQDEYKQTLKDAERQGRLKRKKSQVSAYTEGIEEQINPGFMDSEVEEFMEEFTPETRPPTPEEERIERKKKGGYSPEQGSYYDEVFED